MALGEEVGDAYISVHADTAPFRREVARLRKEFGKEMNLMSKDAKELNTEMDNLGKTTKKTGDTVDKDYNSRMREAARRTVITRDKTADLRTEFTKLLRGAQKIGDEDFASKMEGRLKTLKKATHDYNVDVAGVSKDTDEWRTKNIALNRTLSGLSLTLGKDQDKLKERTEEFHRVSDEQKENIRVSKEHEATLKKLNQTTRKTNDTHGRFGRTLGNTSKKAGFFTRRIRALRSSFQRMDGTVRLVVTLIAVAGNLMAALGSTASAAGVALASVGALALAGLSPLLGVLAPLIYGFVLLKKSFTDEHGNFTLEKVAKMAPEAAKGLGALSKAVNKIDAGALFREWNDSLAKFANTLAHSLTFDVVAQNIGKQFSRITDGLTAVLESPAWTNFVHAVEGPLTTAMGNFGAALGPLISTLLNFMTAAAPFAVALSEQFLAWADGLSAAFSESTKSGEFQTFMGSAVASLTAVTDLVGSLGSALSTVFQAGAPDGGALLYMITNMVDKFTEWANTVEGQSALKEWFDSGLKVMKALFELLGDLGGALADLVTPAVIDDLVGFLGAVGDILPIIGQLLSIIGEAHILDVFTAAIEGIGKVITPLVEPLTRFFDSFSGEALGIIEDAGPLLSDIGESLGRLFDAITPLLPALGEFVSNGLATIIPIATTVIDIIADLFEVFGPLLTKILESKETIGILMGLFGAFMAFKAVKGVVSGLAGAITGFKDGVSAFKDGIGVIKGAAGSVKSAFGTASTAVQLGGLKVKDGIKSIGGAFEPVKDAIGKFGTKLKSIPWKDDSGFLKFGRGLDDVGDKATANGGKFTKLKGVMSKIGGGFKSAGTAVADMTKKLALGTAAVMRNVGAWIAQKAALVASKIAMVAQKVATVVATAVQWLYNAALTANPIGLIVAAIALVVGALVLFFTKTELGKKLWQGFMDAMVIVWDWLKGAFKWLADIAGSIWDGIKQAWDAGVQIVKDLLGNLWDFIKEMFSWSPIGLIITHWDAITGFFATVWDNIKAGFQVIWDFIVNVFTMLNPLPAIKAVWDAITQFFSDFWAAEVRGFQNIWDFIVDLWNKLDPLPKIKIIWDAISSYFGRVIQGWKNIFTGAKDFIISVWNNLNPITLIKTAWDKVTSYFTTFKTTITNIFTGIKDAITNTWKNLVNGIARLWNNSIGKLSFTMPDIPGLPGRGKTINVPDIPYMAAGGIANMPTPVMFGEAGAEALVPLNRPLNQVDPSVRGLSAIAQGIGGAGMSISEGAIVINTRASDGRVIAESVLDRLVSYSR